MKLPHPRGTQLHEEAERKFPLPRGLALVGSCGHHCCAHGHQATTIRPLVGWGYEKMEKNGEVYLALYEC